MKKLLKRCLCGRRCRTRRGQSRHTLDLIEQRRDARRLGDHNVEKGLHKAIRKSGAQDRKEWLGQLIQRGGWEGVRHLRKPQSIKHATIQRPDGTLADTADRANVLADYFEDVQWQIRFPENAPEPRAPIGDSLPINTGPFSMKELVGALSRLHRGKAPGPDGIPPDFWKSLGSDPDASAIMLRLCQKCWEQKSIPESWRRANVVLLFKKGNIELAENYRPISLLQIGYKLLASMIHHRLLQAG